MKKAEIESDNPNVDMPIHTISCNNSLIDPIKPRIFVKNMIYQIICRNRAIFKIFNKNVWFIFFIPVLNKPTDCELFYPFYKFFQLVI